MIKILKYSAVVLGVGFSLMLKCSAQLTQYVTLSATNLAGVSFPVQTNQIVSLVGYDWTHANYVQISGNLLSGNLINLLPFGNLGSSTIGSSQIPQIITGLTNIVLASGNNSSLVWATFQIATPSSANVVSNYVPADAIVIPTSATGNVQIILESSTDLLNWTAASPGTYGASSATNRFFRVRAVHN